MNQLFDLGPEPKTPRAKPRKLMHVIDAGPGIDNEDICKFRCRRCNYESGWITVKWSVARRGIPCPKCNEVGE